MPQISIIVPVYNVENYIRRCIDSILAQTFKDFELILVNDGSPDQSGVICDQYAEKDKRIRVIHKENGGPAEARNVGLDAANGKYVGFVDSDDYIDIHMYEELYKKCEEENIDICTCGRFDVYEDGSKTRNTFVRDSVERWSNKEALENLLTWNGIDSSPCDKLFKMELFENIRFPEDKNVEDIYIIYKLIDMSNGVVHVGKPYYYYYHRLNSRSVEEFSKKRMDILDVTLEIRKFIAQKYPDLNKAANCFYTKNVIFLYMLLQKKSVKRKYRDSYKEVKGHIQRNILMILSNPYIEYNIKAISFLISIGLYDLFKKTKMPNVKFKCNKLQT